MSNYIDAEKLKDEITKRIGKYDSMLHECSIPVVQGKREEAFALLACIDSLQQERSSEVDLEKEIKHYIDENFTITDEIQEIPEEDRMYGIDKGDMLKIARHFYKLGLKARK